MKKLILLGLISAFVDCNETVAMRKFKPLSHDLHERLPFFATTRSSAAPTAMFSGPSNHILLSIQNADEEMLISELDRMQKNNTPVLVNSEILKLLANPKNKEILAIFKERVQSVSIADDVEEIPNGCFAKWKNLSKVTFGETSCLKRIGAEAFCESGVTEIHIPDAITKIDMYCFSECERLSRVSFGPDSKLKLISVKAFDRCFHLTEISIPDNVEELREGCFSGCKNLSRITFGKSSNLKRIGMQAFSDSGLCEIHIPDSVEELPDWCFSHCRNLSRIIFGERSSLKCIGVQAFSANGLCEVYAPKSIKELIEGSLGAERTKKMRFMAPQQAPKTNTDQQ